MTASTTELVVLTMSSEVAATLTDSLTPATASATGRSKVWPTRSGTSV